MKNIDITLASASPRRKELLENAGFRITVSPTNIEENADLNLEPYAYAMQLAEQKCDAHPLAGKVPFLVSADTIVVANNKILNKPNSPEEAKQMLQSLSNNTHEVITAVCIRSPFRKEVFYDSTLVHFNTLDKEAIEYYVQEFNPLDKAGSYGIQEWIGYRYIKGIEGCYYNVMGFPVSKFCSILESF